MHVRIVFLQKHESEVQCLTIVAVRNDHITCKIRYSSSGDRHEWRENNSLSLRIRVSKVLGETIGKP